ncbi:MAG TPA: hypothetical protein VGG72_12965 [Bryobacteraceae bacterium]|jgi:hypothetical protein
MRRIEIGYGEYAGYALREVPDPFLAALRDRFPLDAEKHDPGDSYMLLTTIAVHQELARRAQGGAIHPHIPTVQELAKDIVTKGFRQMSLTHHPDRKGEVEAQKRLNAARDQLTEMCKALKQEPARDSLVIDEDAVRGAGQILRSSR